VRDRVQQGESVGVAQAGHLEFGQPDQLRTGAAGAEDDADRLRQQPARDEGQRAWVALAATPALLAGLLRTLARPRPAGPARQNGSRAARDVN
jgi:hypothetical protein